MNRKTSVSLFLFVAAVLVFTRLDYLVNAELYGFGLQFSDAWWQNYEAIYFCLFQLTLSVLLLYSRNWRMIIVLEAFVLSCGQDLVYFSVWTRGAFPSGNWTWMSMYHLLGVWTTPMQIAFTFALTLTPTLTFLFTHRLFTTRIRQFVQHILS
jgi:hypothetical protein